MRAFLLAATMLLSACQPGVESAKDAVQSVLKDPASAQWKDVRAVGDGNTCGQVNAKNAYGGYAGFRHFLLRNGRLYFSEDELESTQISICCIRLGTPRVASSTHGFTPAEIANSCDRLNWIPVTVN